MQKKIYGIDITKAVTPIEARDAVLRCFYKAHKDVLDDMKEYGNFENKEDLEHMEKLDVQLMVKNFFKEVGGDFDNPDKESIKNVCDKLADFAKHFRNKKVIKKHYNEIMNLLKHIE